MHHPPFFPPWRRRLSAPTHRVGRATLCELERCYGAVLSAALFPKAAQKQNSRDRIYTRWRTVWCVLWQALQPGASGREVVRQLQALFALQDGPRISGEDGAYCRARGRLPVDELAKALATTAHCAERLAGAEGALQGRPVKVVDGSTVTLPDTPANRAAYPAAMATWAGLPPDLTVRVVRGRIASKGYRVREVTVMTTLLDPSLYPAKEVLSTYLRRWRLEMCLDDLKTTRHLDQVRGRSPQMVRQDVYARLIAHPGGRFGAGAARPPRTARGQTQKKQIPSPERTAPPVSRPRQEPRPPRRRDPPQTRPYVSAIPPLGGTTNPNHRFFTSGATPTCRGCGRGCIDPA